MYLDQDAKDCFGKTIASVEMENDTLILHFTDKTNLSIWDGGQSCCEHRYMTCDDDLSSYDNAKLVSIKTESVNDVPDDYEDDRHEIMFLRIYTDNGVIVCQTHNKHNGYYGGFDLATTVGKDK
jgi:hypothetical protein